MVAISCSMLQETSRFSGVTIGPADPALQGAAFSGGAKLPENVGHFLENLTVRLAKVRVLG